MNKSEAYNIVTKCLGMYSEQEFINLMEWVLNGHPFLDGDQARWSRMLWGVP